MKKKMTKKEQEAYNRGLDLVMSAFNNNTLRIIQSCTEARRTLKEKVDETARDRRSS
jgi:hypothetical protein